MVYQRVGVHEDALGVLRQSPALQLGEGEAQLRSTEQLEVGRVLTVQNVHVHHRVERVQQLVSDSVTRATIDGRLRPRCTTHDANCISLSSNKIWLMESPQ